MKKGTILLWLVLIMVPISCACAIDISSYLEGINFEEAIALLEKNRKESDAALAQAEADFRAITNGLRWEKEYYSNHDVQSGDPSSEKERRDVFYFIEEYSKRWIKEAPTDFEFRPSEQYYNSISPYRIEGYISVNCDAGRLLINMDDFTIQEYSTIICYLGEEEDSGLNVYNSSVAASVLEIDSTDGNFLYLVGGSPVFQMKDMLWQGINNATGEQFDRLVEKGEEIVIFQGNYTYSIDYYKNDDSQILWLVAK